jgi:uncharacterized protein YdhG (YjbR/CyaY superfamily)
MKQSVPKSVDEYIAAQPEALRPKLEQVRAAIRRAVPEAVEGIGYRMPGYKLLGKPMLYFAGFKEHYSLFAASGTFFAALEDELRGYELRKGTVQFPLTKPVPVKLIGRIAKLRAAGIAATAEKPLLGQERERRKWAPVGDRVARPREAVGCRTLICRNADSGQSAGKVATPFASLKMLGASVPFRSILVRHGSSVNPADRKSDSNSALEERFDGEPFLERARSLVTRAQLA